ncbi:MAG: ABC transporter ATP-binding protein, partial [Actinobacteria bacterium]|nr:ABC transporter ATP-binding protein [Actinomycetota bacterium]
PGQSAAIIGANGAGKSTLLKIVSGVMFPHSGRIATGGRVGALIEVMSGIHPELTGRENVIIYGMLLGLGRKQVASKLDEIIAFAELEDAVERQVKFYSSGMRMRLGFAVAAFLEPSILIVDEVLAVGDTSFQQKCLDRMRDVVQSGTTLLLVSHDLAAVGATANRGIWLDDGIVRADGSIESVLRAYRGAVEADAAANAQVEGLVRVEEVHTDGPGGDLVQVNELCVVHLTVSVTMPRAANLYVGVSEGAPTPIFVVRNEAMLEPGTTRLRLTIPKLPLPPGQYFLWFGAYEVETRIEFTPWQPVAPLTVVGARSLDPTPQAIVRLSPVFVDARWSRAG